MNSPTTQEAIAQIRQFLEMSVPYGVLVAVGTGFIILLGTYFFIKSKFTKALRDAEIKKRKAERAVADLEAHQSQVRAELEDLRKAEAILIQRNGVLEERVNEYEIYFNELENQLKQNAE